MIIATLLWLYKRSLHAFPKNFRAMFEDEMVTVFQELLVQQAQQSLRSVLSASFREFYRLPGVLLRLHWRERRKHPTNLSFVRAVWRSPFHPVPPVNDGRFSWWQTLLETGLVILVAILLLTTTYLQPAWLPIDWQWSDISSLIALISLPIFLLGLVRQLPRWAYPAGGLIWGHLLFTSQTPGLLYFWVVMLLASFVLLLAAVYIHLHHEPLSPLLQRLGQRLALDWTRTSFGFYAVLPFVIVSAFDDTFPNGRTAYFALALLTMIVGAVAYCRSRHQKHQLSVLVGSITVVLMLALLEQIYFQADWIADLIWLSPLWAALVTLLLLPIFASVIYRSWIKKRSPQMEG